MRSVLRTSTLSATALLLAAALAACSPVAPVKEGTDAPDSSSSGAVAADFSPYYPVAEGNEWEYTATYPDPVGVVTYTETMTKVEKDGDDVRATIARSFHYENGMNPDFDQDVEYVFHADGSLTVPYQSLPDTSGAQVTVKSGELVWPSTEEFEAATPKTGTIELTSEAAGVSLELSAAFTITGAGVESVTVKAGDFDARKLAQVIEISVPTLSTESFEVSTTTWLAEGTGMVRTEIPGLFGAGATVVELVKFTPGS